MQSEAGVNPARPRHCQRLLPRTTSPSDDPRNRPARSPHWRSRWEGEPGCLEPGDRSRSLPHSNPLEGGARGERSATRLLFVRWPRLAPSSLSTCQDGIFVFSRAGGTSESTQRERRNPDRRGSVDRVRDSRAMPRFGAQVPGEVRGRITDAQSGLSIGGARIEVVGQATDPRSPTSAAHSFFAGSSRARSRVRVRAVGHVSRDTVVAVANGRSSELDVALQASRLSSRRGCRAIDAGFGERDRPFDRTRDRADPDAAISENCCRACRALSSRATADRIAESDFDSRLRGERGARARERSPINSAISGDADLSSIGLERAERVTVLHGSAVGALRRTRARRRRRHRDAPRGAGSIGRGIGGRVGRAQRQSARSVGRASAERVRAAASVTADYRDVRGDFSYDIPAVRGGGTARRFNADARSTGVLATASIDARTASRATPDQSGVADGDLADLPGSIVQPSTTGRQHDSRCRAASTDAGNSVD